MGLLMVEFRAHIPATTTQNGVMKWDLMNMLGPFKPNRKQFLRPTGGYLDVQDMMIQTGIGVIGKMDTG